MNQKLFQRLNRRAAAEGIVLLKNEEQMLPFQNTEQIAIYGRPAFDYYRSGTGSGGAVNVPYTTNLMDGLHENEVRICEDLEACYKTWLKTHPFENGGGGWAAEPWFQEDMPLTENIVRNAAAQTQKACYVIGRTAGEDQDNKKEPGSWYLTDTERENLEMILSVHEKVAILFNVSNIMDMSFMSSIRGKEHIKAVLYLWQGGMEGGAAAGEVLAGVCAPSGKLPDTIADQIEDYPSDANFGSSSRNLYGEDIYVGYRYFETFAKDKVLYPFGFGLSYTEFHIEVLQARCALFEQRFQVRVTNQGDFAGKEVVQLYASMPQGTLGQPDRVLVSFEKTRLLKPGESQILTLHTSLRQLASYDDSGCSGHRSCYVAEAGCCYFYIGNSIRDAVPFQDGCLELKETLVLEICEEAAAPEIPFSVLKPGRRKADGTYEEQWVPVSQKTVDIRERVEQRLPEAYPITGDRGITLQQVRDGQAELLEFTAQLTVEDLAALVRGEGMSHPAVTRGTAAAYGGVSDRLQRYGIPLACCADGPSGLRMEAESVQLPIGTMLSATWNTELIRALYACEGKLMCEHQVDTLLGPGINIHRHPLNGRNFEYYSEDPYLSGSMAVAVTAGLRKGGAHGTVKHFACNGQESFRHRIEAVCSERALRELYLKSFEMAVKSGNVRSLMTSYNPINGHWAASHYDLNTTILRGEWGYSGVVMTDWWARMNDVSEGGMESEQDTRDMIRAQNDLYMVVNNYGAEVNSNHDNTIEAVSKGRLTLGELQRSAENICRFLLQAPVIERALRVEEQAEFVPADRTTSSKKVEQGLCIRVEGKTQVHFQVAEAGVYTIVIRMSSKLTNLAQSTSRLLLNDQVVTVVQTNGTEGKWITQKLQKVELEAGYYKLDIVPVQAGLEIETIEFK